MDFLLPLSECIIINLRAPFPFMWSRVLCTAQIQSVKVRLCEYADCFCINKAIVLKLRDLAILCFACMSMSMECSSVSVLNCWKKKEATYSPLFVLFELSFVLSDSLSVPRWRCSVFSSILKGTVLQKTHTTILLVLVWFAAITWTIGQPNTTHCNASVQWCSKYQNIKI